MVGMKQRKSEDEGKEEEYWMAPAILKWARSGPWGGGMKASQLPAPKRNIGPLVLPLNSGLSVDGQWAMQ